MSWLDVDGVADRLGVSTRTIYRWIRSEDLPCYAVGTGKLLRFDPDEVDAWVRDRRVS